MTCTGSPGSAAQPLPHLIGVEVVVSISNNPTVGEIATYARGSVGHVDFNMGRLGKKWFGGPAVKIITLVIHEFAHQMSGNHLSEEYYDALTEIGAKMTMLALDHREILEILPCVPSVPHLSGRRRKCLI
jgi:hypothetical protein